MNHATPSAFAQLCSFYPEWRQTDEFNGPMIIEEGFLRGEQVTVIDAALVPPNWLDSDWVAAHAIVTNSAGEHYEARILRNGMVMVYPHLASIENG